MAVIQKIRERYAKLAGFVIALSLVAFIISEGINGSFGSFFGKDTSVAKVNGDKVDAQEYYNNVQEYISLSELYRKGQPLTDADRAQIQQSVLEQMVMEKLIQKDAGKLGLTVSDQEAKEMFGGVSPDPAVQQFPYFADPQTGQFNPQAIKQFENAVKKGGSTPEESEQIKKAGEQWSALKKVLVRSRLVQKYNAMISGGAYTPDFMLKRDEQELAMQAGIRFVKIPLTTVDDSKVKITDADLKAYMERHKAQFMVDQPTRSIDYVVFDINPDAEDTMKSKTALETLKPRFATTTDDKKFVTSNSDGRYDDAYVTKKTYPSAFADSIFAQPVGSVYGPYFEKDAYMLTKVTARTTMPDSVKCRHILVQTEKGGQPALDSATAKARIDSVAAAIAAGADFKAMVAKYSDDEGSKATGGEYDFTLAQRAGISKEFGDFIFEGKPGEKKVVKVSNPSYSGYHYIEIINQKDPVTAVKLATVSKTLITSTRSSNAVLSKANAFAGNNNNAQAFDAAIKKEMLNKRVAEDIKPSDFTLQGLGAARDLIHWLYGAKEGEVSNPIQIDNHYVVAKVTAIQEPGLRPLTANLRAQLEGMVKAEQKAKIIADQYKSAQSLDAIAQSSGQPVQTADSIKGNAAFTPAIGFEPKIMGYIFSDKLQPNTLSPALKGRDGVFFITLVHRNTVPLSDGDKMAMQQQKSMESMQAKNYINSMLPEALRRNGTVTYNAKNIR